MPLTQNEKHPTALRTNTLFARALRSIAPARAGERAYWQIPAQVLSACVALGLTTSACVGDQPQFTQGTTGNAIQIMKPPVEVPHFDSGPHIIDPSCLTTAAALQCKVSFSMDIYPNMESMGEWKCANAHCHAPGATLPAIGDGNAPGTYNSLIAYTSDALDAYYVTPCKGNDLSQSSIVCNLGGDQSGFCSSPMPQAGVNSSAPSTTELQQIKDWLACGAPNN